MYYRYHREHTDTTNYTDALRHMLCTVTAPHAMHNHQCDAPMLRGSDAQHDAHQVTHARHAARCAPIVSFLLSLSRSRSRSRSHSRSLLSLSLPLFKHIHYVLFHIMTAE